MKQRRRAGRIRIAGRRYPSGDLHREDTKPPAVLRREAQFPTVSPQDPRCGRALGELLLRGLITQVQHDAGETARGVWLRYRTAIAAPLAHAPAVGARKPGAPKLPDEQGELRAEAAYADLRAVLHGTRPSRLVCEVMELVCALDTVPLHIGHPPVIDALRTGLDATARLYRLGQKAA